MAKLKILTGENNDILRAKSILIKKFDAELKKLVKAMKETLIAQNGLGLAAPQIGKNIRLFVLFLDYKTDDQRIVTMINPRIISRSDEMEIDQEGCLSLPGIWGNVVRYRDIVVEFSDVEGTRQILLLSGLNAREVQHEYDHLEGILFIDKMEKPKNERSELIM